MNRDLQRTRRVFVACSVAWVVAFGTAVPRFGFWWTLLGLAWGLPILLAAVAALALVLRPARTRRERAGVAPALP